MLSRLLHLVKNWFTPKVNEFSSHFMSPSNYFVPSVQNRYLKIQVENTEKLDFVAQLCDTINEVQNLIGMFSKPLLSWASSEILTVKLNNEFSYDRKYLNINSKENIVQQISYAILDAIRPDLWNTYSPQICEFYHIFAEILVSFKEKPASKPDYIWEFSSNWHDFVIAIQEREEIILHQAYLKAMKCLLKAITYGAKTSRYFNSLAKSMITFDSMDFCGYANVIREKFHVPDDMISSPVTWENLVWDLHDQDKVIRRHNRTVVCIVTIKSVLLNIPEYGLVEITIPADVYYEFDSQGILIQLIQSDETEAVISPKDLNDWSIVDGKMLRNFVVFDKNLTKIS